MNVNAVTGADGTVLAVEAENNTSKPNKEFSNYIDKTMNYAAYLDKIFQKASETYHVSKDLLKAMAKAESSFRADATSRAGAMGIMQLMPATAASLGVTDAYDPEQNIMGGAKYMRQLLDKYQNQLSYAIAAYNAGSGNVDKYGGIPPFTETQNYVAKVLRYLEEGVTIPGSTGSTTDTNVVSGSEDTSRTSALKEIMDKYFDYDDYLEFLQLFTRIISEKITGKALTAKEDDEESGSEETAPVQAEEVVQEPVKQLQMTVRDTQGHINVYHQLDTAASDSEENSDAYLAYQYLTSSGRMRMGIKLTPTV